MDLLYILLETCTTLTRKVEALEQDKVDQALEIIKLKQRIKKLERKNKLKVSGLRRLRKVGTAQKVESSGDTVMDDQEDASKQEGIIELIDADKDVSLETAEIEKDVDVQGRQVESQAQIYKMDLEHADKVLSMDDDELEPIELKDVVEVVTTAKLMTEVVTFTGATITAATTPITNVTLTAAPKKRERRQCCDEVSSIEEKATDRSPAIKNMMIYLRNMAGFKMDYFKGMSYDDILPNNDDDIYTEATPLALRVIVIDYEIHTENNKPYFKIKRDDGTR
nr:hypothetical protein [Tanacetum cinerariifolium]